MRLLSNLIVPALALCVLGMPVLAQETGNEGGEKPSQRPPRGEGAPPGGPGVERGPGAGMQRNPPMTAEKARAAWEWQAKGVSKTLGLSDDLTTKTIATYVEARESYKTTSDRMRKEATDKMREAAESGAEPDPDARRAQAAEMRKKDLEMRKAETDKLSAKLGTILASEQVTKAMTSMGSFDLNWDRMVHMLVEFKLDDAKMHQGLSALEQYEVSLAKFRDSEDRSGVRGATREARDTLTESMKKILTEEQMTQFQRAGQMQPRGQGGAGAPGAGGRGGDGGDGGGQGGGRGGAGGSGNDGTTNPET